MPIQRRGRVHSDVHKRGQTLERPPKPRARVEGAVIGNVLEHALLRGVRLSWFSRLDADTETRDARANKVYVFVVGELRWREWWWRWLVFLVRLLSVTY